MANSPILFGGNNTSINLQNQILQANGTLLQNSGEKNYITYNNFENGATTGWSLGTTGTLTNGIPTGTPTFGSGASGNLSLTTSTSAPIAGTTSLSLVSSAATTAGNMLATDSLAIDSADQAKVITGKFYYTVPTNPTNGNFSGTSSNSFGIACYDVTNSSWLPVVGNFAMTQNSGVGIATVTMQTNLTTASVRFIIYNANASAGAITVNFDRFCLGPQTAPIGYVGIDWQAYTPTYVGFGTVTTVEAWWKRVGDSILLRGRAQLGITTAATASISLPGVTISTATELSTATYGTLVNQAKTTSFVINAPSGGTAVQIGSVASSPLSGALGTAVGSSSDTISWSTDPIPISGWSSNVQMSNDTDTRVVAARYKRSTAQSVSSGASATLIFPTIDFDTHGAYNTSTGIYTVPVSGYYRMSAAWLIDTGSYIAGDNIRTYVLKNGSENTVIYRFQPGVATGTHYAELVGSTVVSCVAGDTLALGLANNASSSRSNIADATYNHLSIERLSGPAIIAAVESINCRYTTTAGQSLTASVATIVNFDTKEYDSHNAVTTGASWKYTAPVSGVYDVTSFNHPAVGTSYVELYKNGVNYARIGQQPTTNGCLGATSIKLLAGDYIQLYIIAGTTTTLNASAALQWIAIKRVGN